MPIHLKSSAPSSGGVNPSIVVTTEAGATVTAIMGDLVVTGVAGDNGICVLEVPEYGEWSVVCELDGSSSGEIIINVGTHTISGPLASPVLNDNSWETISTISSAGAAANCWSVGDKKAITLNGTVGSLTFSEEVYYCYIIGFDHNSAIEGTNRIHFQFGYDINNVNISFIDSGAYNSKTSGSWFNINNSNSTFGGWENCQMRTVICPEFKACLPSELQTVLKNVTKYTDNTGDGSGTASYITATADTVFLLAEWEVFGERSYANSAEQNYQAQYEYYIDGNSKIKYNPSATTVQTKWWLRSPRSIYTTDFCYVTYYGTSSTEIVVCSLGFAPAFCV